MKGLDEETLRREHPIANLLPGWSFRMEEQSPEVWRVEGTDVWGRTVGDIGIDVQRVFASCVGMATAISRQLAANAAPPSPFCP